MQETECTPYILLGALLIYIGCLCLETCWDLWMLREYEFDIIREQSNLRYLLSLNSENRQRTRTDSRITYYLFTAESHCKWSLRSMYVNHFSSSVNSISSFSSCYQRNKNCPKKNINTRRDRKLKIMLSAKRPSCEVLYSSDFVDELSQTGLHIDD